MKALLAVAVLLVLVVVLTVPPTATGTGVPRIGFMGDSITAGYGGSTTPYAEAQVRMRLLSPTAAGIGYGVSGSTSGDWISGSTNLNTFFSVLNSNTPITAVSIMLGTNDAKTAVATSAATYQSNLQSTITALISVGYGTIMLCYAPYIVVPNGFNQWDSNSNPLLVQYQGALQALVVANPGHVTMGDNRAYAFFQANQSLLADGVHPTDTGYGYLGALWADAVRNNYGPSYASFQGVPSLMGSVQIH